MSRIARIRELARLSRDDLEDKAWVLEIEINAAMSKMDIARLIEEQENQSRERRTANDRRNSNGKGGEEPS